MSSNPGIDVGNPHDEVMYTEGGSAAGNDPPPHHHGPPHAVDDDIPPLGTHGAFHHPSRVAASTAATETNEEAPAPGLHQEKREDLQQQDQSSFSSRERGSSYPGVGGRLNIMRIGRPVHTGVTGAGAKFSFQESMAMVRTIRRILPTCREEWEMVQEHHEGTFGNRRTVEALRRKYNGMVNKRPTDGVELTDDIILAKKTAWWINQKTNTALDDNNELDPDAEEEPAALQEMLQNEVNQVSAAGQNDNDGADNDGVAEAGAEAATPTVGVGVSRSSKSRRLQQLQAQSQLDEQDFSSYQMLKTIAMLHQQQLQADARRERNRERERDEDRRRERMKQQERERREEERDRREQRMMREAREERNMWMSMIMAMHGMGHPPPPGAPGHHAQSQAPAPPPPPPAAPVPYNTYPNSYSQPYTYYTSGPAYLTGPASAPASRPSKRSDSKRRSKESRKSDNDNGKGTKTTGLDTDDEDDNDRDDDGGGGGARAGDSQHNKKKRKAANDDESSVGASASSHSDGEQDEGQTSKRITRSSPPSKQSKTKKTR